MNKYENYVLQIQSQIMNTRYLLNDYVRIHNTYLHAGKKNVSSQ